MSENPPDPSLPVGPSPGAHEVPLAQAVPLGYASAAYAPYVSPAPRARVLVGWLWASVVALVAMLWSTARAVVERRAWLAGTEPTDEVTTGMIVEGAIGLAAGIVLLVAFVLWLMWVHRTYRNLAPLGADGLWFTPRWAVAYYFIPVLNIFRPFQVMRETWRASDPSHRGGTDWRAARVPVLVSVWWGLILTSGAAAMVSVGFEFQEGSPRALLTASCIDLGTGVVDLVVVVLEIVLVKRLTALQERRAAGADAALG